MFKKKAESDTKPVSSLQETDSSSDPSAGKSGGDGANASKKTQKKKFGFFDWILILIFIGGLGFFLYPTFSDLWNSWRQSKLTTQYVQTATQLREEDYTALFEEARDFNRKHAEEGIYNPEGPLKETNEIYAAHLNPGNSTVMAVLKIPKIDQTFNVFYGTDESILEEGVGHLKGTSLPTGDPGTHTVIIGHTGLPTAKIFTDIHDLVEGDLFTLQVLDQTFAYKVDQIKTVLPTEIEDLTVIPDKDYVTLLTCTPYGVNSHRLLVRGERTELEEEERIIQEIREEEKKISPILIAAASLGGLLVCGLLYWLFSLLRRKKKEKQSQKQSQSQDQNDNQTEAGADTSAAVDSDGGPVHPDDQMNPPEASDSSSSKQ